MALNNVKFFCNFYICGIHIQWKSHSIYYCFMESKERANAIVSLCNSSLDTSFPCISNYVFWWFWIMCTESATIIQQGSLISNSFETRSIPWLLPVNYFFIQGRKDQRHPVIHCSSIWPWSWNSFQRLLRHLKTNLFIVGAVRAWSLY